MKDMVEMFVKANTRAIDAEGIRIPQAIARMDDGSLTVVALAMSGRDACYQAFRAICLVIGRDRPCEVVWGWDRFTRPGQGTTLGDLLTVHHWAREHRSCAGWRFGIMEYQHEPRIVKPVCWENPFWTAMLRAELASQMQHLAAEAMAKKGAR